MAAAWTSVIDAVTTVATNATSARVVRGRDITDDPSDIVMVGVRDLQSGNFESAGSFTQEFLAFGGSRKEMGTVNCLILVRTGDSDQGAAFDTAAGYLASIEAAVRTDPTLGLALNVVAQTQAGDVQEARNEFGATVALTFAIYYDARI